MGVYVIAEMGDNHNGDPKLAYELVDKAVEAKADCVKFQVFKTEEMMLRSAEKAEYQKENTGTEENQYMMVKKLELDFCVYRDLYRYCKHRDIDFLATPFDITSAKFLEELGMKQWKIPSGEITNYPLLTFIASTHKPIILSTGMCTMDEVKASVKVLENHGAGEIKLLHCTSDYPTKFGDVNLKAMDSLRETFPGKEVGYSDHTLGIYVPVAAVAKGAKIIEKHYTLDKKMDGPDHIASLDPKELKAMVVAIRQIEMALGAGEKIPTHNELSTMKVARKSIVARRNIKAGDLFTEENLTTKRPGTGVSPMHWPEMLGKRAKNNYIEDDFIAKDEL